LKNKGSLLHSFELDLSNTKYTAESVYWGSSGKWPAELAEPGSGYYWCSKYNAPLPTHWWMTLQKPLEIVSIAFEEAYKGATFEFIGTDTKNARGKSLIKGTRDEINDVEFANGKSYRHYGFKITSYGKKKYASLKNFQFYVKASADEE